MKYAGPKSSWSSCPCWPQKRRSRNVNAPEKAKLETILIYWLSSTMDVNSIQTPAGDSLKKKKRKKRKERKKANKTASNEMQNILILEWTVLRKKRRRKQKKKKAKNEGELQSMDLMDDHLEVPAIGKLCIVADNDLQNNLIELDSTAQLHAGQSKMDTRSTENVTEGIERERTEGTVQRKKRKKKRNKKKAKNEGELQSVDHRNALYIGKNCPGATIDLQNNVTELDSTAQSHEERSRSTENISEETVNLIEGTMQRNKRRRKQNKKKAKNKDELQSLDQMDENLEAPNISIGLDSTAQLHAEQSTMGTRSTENLAEGLEQRKRWRKHNKKRATTKDELQSANCMSSPNLSDINHGIRNDGKLIANESTTPSLHLGSGPSEGPREMEVEMFSCESRHIPLLNEMYSKNEKIENEFNEEEIIVYQGKDSAVCSSYDVKVTKQLYSPILKQDHLANDSSAYLKIAPVASVRRKLLVLDVNGLLADIVMPAPKYCIADTHILGRAVFRRPFYVDFLKFCFENFDVAIWSSRSKKIIDKVVNYLLGDLQRKLLFCWDMSQSTQTSFKTVENLHKPLVLKELKKIWEKEDDPNLPWEKGYYNESNTLLVDDSPYKALLNPLHTAIFPYSYHYKDKSDNSLGPGGNLRVYLEDMLKCDNVKKYVEQHPFGQGAIDETNEFWSFYSRVLESVSAVSV
ncbi:unnamed protein product [Fraxinus pennsylvanica]|uniref:FCP1 homology domain-containing protein n=1 Tax=Fraxinus pennsylvanica TaxID=56036 RepID=A0AAD1YM95_9LAMI|nr:unnamed protein product [Fraxinus pennsylvanica]